MMAAPTSHGPCAMTRCKRPGFALVLACVLPMMLAGNLFAGNAAFTHVPAKPAHTGFHAIPGKPSAQTLSHFAFQPDLAVEHIRFVKEGSGRAEVCITIRNVGRAASAATRASATLTRGDGTKAKASFDVRALKTHAATQVKWRIRTAAGSNTVKVVLHDPHNRANNSRQKTWFAQPRNAQSLSGAQARKAKGARRALAHRKPKTEGILAVREVTFDDHRAKKANVSWVVMRLKNTGKAPTPATLLKVEIQPASGRRERKIFSVRPLMPGETTRLEGFFPMAPGYNTLRVERLGRSALRGFAVLGSGERPFYKTHYFSPGKTPRRMPAKRREQAPTAVSQAMHLPKYSRLHEAGAKAAAINADRLSLPDLEAANLQISPVVDGFQEHSPLLQYRYHVNIINSGTADIQKPFYLSIQRYDPLLKRWGGERERENCQSVKRLLKKGESFTAEGTMQLPSSEVSGKTIRIRAYADAGCYDEFAPAWGSIRELREDNNTSNSVPVGGTYLPVITKIQPSVAKIGDKVYIIGTGFGSQADYHVVRMQHGDENLPVPIDSWHDGAIAFTVSQFAQPERYKVSIADSGSPFSLSNEVPLAVQGSKYLAWDELIASWNSIVRDDDDINLTLNTYGGGKALYKNTSSIHILRDKSINVPKMDFDIGHVDYRFLIKDMRTRPGGILLSREGCQAGQVKMILDFESGGVEVKAYSKARLKGAKWCDGCVPDIQVDHARMTVTFNFKSNNGRLDYATVATRFDADVHAANRLTDILMNRFLRHWNRTVRRDIAKGARDAFLDPATKKYLTAELDNIVRLLAGLGNKTVTAMDFVPHGIYLTYH